MDKEIIEVGIKALIIKDNKYLAVHKSGIIDDKYELPGGRVQFGETMEDTVVREVKEELNLDIKPMQLIDTWNYVNMKHKRQVIGVIYYCEVLNDVQEIQLSNEHTDFQWFPIGEISHMNMLFDCRMSKWDWDKIS